MRLALAVIAVLAFASTFLFSSAAERSRCIESVRRLRVEGGTVGEVLEARHPHFHWVYDRDLAGRMEPGTPRVANVAFESDSLVPVYAWTCSDDPVPLVLAVNGPARELTPNRVYEP